MNKNMDLNIAFDHIEQTRYLLYQIFESGFDSGRNASVALGDCERRAAELGMSGGAKLLGYLSGNLNAFAAGQCTLSGVAAAYCQGVAYYNRVADLLIIETMSNK